MFFYASYLTQYAVQYVASSADRGVYIAAMFILFILANLFYLFYNIYLFYLLMFSVPHLHNTVE